MPYYRCPACGLTTYSAAGYTSASVCSACLEALPADDATVNDEVTADSTAGLASELADVVPAHADAVAL
jgi:hypothetical protein